MILILCVFSCDLPDLPVTLGHDWVGAMPLLGNTVKARKRAVPGKTSSNGKCAANAAALATALPACAAASSAIDMNEEARSERSVSHRSTRSEIPTSDQIEKYNLPTNYRIKYCRLCDNGSLTTCDYVEVGTAWGLLLPWGNGTRACPSGVYCRRELKGTYF